MSYLIILPLKCLELCLYLSGRIVHYYCPRLLPSVVKSSLAGWLGTWIECQAVWRRLWEKYMGSPLRIDTVWIGMVEMRYSFIPVKSALFFLPLLHGHPLIFGQYEQFFDH